MSDLRTDTSLGARIEALEAEIAADHEAAQAEKVKERAANDARAKLLAGITNKRAALAELQKAWDARELPERVR